jgi:ABC-type multidrug transport system ATPase subunit
MLRVKKLKLFNGKEISFDLSRGESLQIKGANGVGKSLLLKSLARLIPSEWDELSLDGKKAEDFRIEEWRSKILYIPPEVVFDPELTVDEFFNEPFQLLIYKDYQKNFEPRDHWPQTEKLLSQLSSGQRQQVALLRALSLDPSFLLLDEPFGYMDIETRDFFSNLLNKWCVANRSLILVSHIESLSNTIKIVL